MKRKSKLTIAIATAVLAVLDGTAAYAQDKYSLKSPSGIAFSDFKGYEDWSVISSARTDKELKVIVSLEVGECDSRSEEHTSELQSLRHLVCRPLLGKKKE